MIVERGRGRAVHIRYRDQDGKRQTLIERDYYPYCFVETADQDIFDAVYREDGYTGLYGENLTKLVVNDPQQIMEIQEMGRHLWSKDMGGEHPLRQQGTR